MKADRHVYLMEGNGSGMGGGSNNNNGGRHLMRSVALVLLLLQSYTISVGGDKSGIAE